jgi:hypothetical protein
MSACRSLTKYLFYFFNNDSVDNKQEGSVVTTQANPINENPSFPDFVRSVVGSIAKKSTGDLIAEVRLYNAHAREINRLKSLLIAEKKSDIRESITKQINDHLMVSNCDRYGMLGILLGVETDPDIRKEIIERILNGYNHFQNRLNENDPRAFEVFKVANTLAMGGSFLLKNEKTPEVLRCFLACEKTHSAFAAHFLILDSSQERMALIRRVRELWSFENDLPVLPFRFLKEVVDKITSEEAKQFLPYLADARTRGYKGYYWLPTQVWSVAMQMRDLNLVTMAELEDQGVLELGLDRDALKKNIITRKREAQVNTTLSEWEKILEDEIKAKEDAQKKFSISQVESLERAVCCEGNDGVLSLLMDCILKGENSKELKDYLSKNKIDEISGVELTGLSLFCPPMSFALSRVFKKGYPFAKLETKKKLKEFLLRQLIFLYKNVEGYQMESMLEILALPDLLRFVMTNMQSDDERMQYFTDLKTQREVAIKGKGETYTNITIELLVHCVRLHRAEQYLQRVVSLPESTDINVPKKISNIVKG